MRTLGRTYPGRHRSVVLGFAAASVIFVTSAAVPADAEQGVQVVRDVAYAQRGDRVLRADLYLPEGDGPHPTVLMLHGGAWAAGNKTHNAWHARRLAKSGYAAVAIEYRLAPLYPFPAQLEDCRGALDWVVKQEPYRLDPRRLAAFGYSAGGHLACLLGLTLAAETPPSASPALRAVVAGGAPCDFRREPVDSTRLAFWLGGTRRESPAVYRSASPAHHTHDRAPPVFFFHGDRDRVVPKSNPLSFHQLLQRQGIETEFFLIPNAGHLAAYVDWRAFQGAVQFLDHYVRDASVE